MCIIVNVQQPIAFVVLKFYQNIQYINIKLRLIVKFKNGFGPPSFKPVADPMVGSYLVS